MTNLLAQIEDIEKSHQLVLNFVCEIIPKKDKTGQIFENDFEQEIAGMTGLRLSQYGKGPFCRFSLPLGYSGKPGIYFIFEDESLHYIGECMNLETRFNMGYGLIELRNCLHNGQQTNCRINHLILEGIRNQHRYFLYFYETPVRKVLESRLIMKYHPPWNRTHTNQSRLQSLTQTQKTVSSDRPDKKCTSGKYEKLYNALKASETKERVLTFPEIESLLGFALPTSAYKYRPWWANDFTHSQAKAWLNADWKVIHVNLGKSIKFSKYH